MVMVVDSQAIQESGGGGGQSGHPREWWWWWTVRPSKRVVVVVDSQTINEFKGRRSQTSDGSREGGRGVSCQERQIEK